MSISIRKGSTEDVRALAPRIFDRFHAYYAVRGSKDHEVLVALYEGKPVGFVEFKAMELNGRRILHLYYVGVLEEFRRRGVGRALISTAERVGVRLRLAYSVATTQSDNEASIRFFKSLGYYAMDFDDFRLEEVLGVRGWRLAAALFAYEDDLLLIKQLSRRSTS